MLNMECITSLKSQSTWRLLGLGIITIGIYFAHYIRGQTAKLNQYLDESSIISKSFIDGFVLLSYLSVLLIIPYILVDDGHPIEMVSDILDFIWSIYLLVWGFKARNRVNKICQLRSDEREWFSGLWTFLFTPLYFNYKVNVLCESFAEHKPPEGRGEAPRP